MGLIPDEAGPEVIEQLVEELKSQGVFDKVRNECLGEVDTKVITTLLRYFVVVVVGSIIYPSSSCVFAAGVPESPWAGGGDHQPVLVAPGVQVVALHEQEHDQKQPEEAHSRVSQEIMFVCLFIAGDTFSIL